MVSCNRPVTSGVGFKVPKDNMTIRLKRQRCSINNSKRPITVINLLIDILDSNNKQLTIHSRVFEIKTKLLPQDYLSKAFSCEINKILPKKDYKIKLKIITSYKNYNKIIPIPFFDDYVQPVYEEISKGIEQNLIE